MIAVILAAGRGSRLRPFTDKVPKPLLRVGGRAILTHTLAEMPAAITSIVLVVGYKGEMVEAALGSEFDGRPIRYVRQPHLLGTADALWCCRKIVSGEMFLVLMGDDLYDGYDLQALIGAGLSFGVFRTKEPEPRFRVNVRVASDGVLAGLDNLQYEVSYPEEWLISTGAYVLDRRVFDHPRMQVSANDSELGLPQTLAASGIRLKVVEMKWWQPIAAASDFARAEEALARKTHGRSR